MGLISRKGRTVIGDKTRRPMDDNPKLKILGEECQADLKFLCTQFLGYQDWDNSVHSDVMHHMMSPAKKKALLLPRGHLKSSLVTVAYSIQRIIKNPNVRILLANQIWDQARRFLGEIKGHLEASQLKCMFGDFVSARWNQDDIIVRQRTKPLASPTIQTTGVEAEQTGGHFDVIILDDLTGLQNSQTPEQREKTKRFRRSMINLLDPGGELIEIGTRWHLDDTFAEILEKESKYYKIMCRKVVEDGKIIFPKHFSKRFNIKRQDWESVPTENCMDYIQHLKDSMPIDEFSAQYLNEPISLENALFKPGMFKWWNQRPEGLFIGMAVDLAISESRQSDRTAVVVMGMDEKYQLYALDYLVGRWGPKDIVDKVFEMRNRWKPMAVGMEVNGFQRTLKLACEEEMRRRREYFPIDEIRTGPERTKENRIKSMEPFYRNGTVFHAAWMKGKEMETELQTFPKGKHDDIVDAMSMCLPLLHPGTGERQRGVEEGSWEWWFRKAQDSNVNHRGFFGGNP